jgi:hypothetical protein
MISFRATRVDKKFKNMLNIPLVKLVHYIALSIKENANHNNIFYLFPVSSVLKKLFTRSVA